jgi:hypothetical protein
MMDNLLQMPALQLDANGLPRGHKMGLFAARQEYCDFLNELPDSWLHIGPTDSELGSERVIAAYLAAVKKEQR